MEGEGGREGTPTLCHAWRQTHRQMAPALSAYTALPAQEAPKQTSIVDCYGFEIEYSRIISILKHGKSKFENSLLKSLGFMELAPVFEPGTDSALGSASRYSLVTWNSRAGIPMPGI